MGLKGTGEAPFRYKVSRYANLSTVSAWLTSLEALQGSIVSIVDGRGDTITDLLIVQVSPRNYAPVIHEGVERFRGTLTISGVKVS